jgi:hypothetical protein
MTGKTGISYSNNLTDMIFINQENNMQSNEIKTNIFFQNGMMNNIQTANEIGSMLEKAVGRQVGLIINSTGGIDDVTEFLPNQLYLKDALNGEVLQQIAVNTPDYYKNLVLLHSAGNEDVIKAAAVLRLNKVNLNNKIDFISAGSPKSAKELQKALEPIGGNLIAQYNTILDPVTNSKAWVVGTSTLLIAAAMYGAGLGSNATATGTGLQSYFSGGLGGALGGAIGGALGFGSGYYLLDKNHPFVNYFDNDFKGLQTDIKNWSQQNPAY